MYFYYFGQFLLTILMFGYFLVLFFAHFIIYGYFQGCFLCFQALFGPFFCFPIIYYMNFSVLLNVFALFPQFFPFFRPFEIFFIIFNIFLNILDKVKKTAIKIASNFNLFIFLCFLFKILLAPLYDKILNFFCAFK